VRCRHELAAKSYPIWNCISIGVNKAFSTQPHSLDERIGDYATTQNRGRNSRSVLLVHSLRFSGLARFPGLKLKMRRQDVLGNSDTFTSLPPEHPTFKVERNPAKSHSGESQ
jgi:hypothetical protein